MPPSSTSSGAASTPAWTRGATSISTTPGGPVRGVTACRARRARARGGAGVLPRLAGGVRGGLRSERDRRAAPGRRGVSLPGRRSLPAHFRQPQLSQRHPRVRARGAETSHVPSKAPELRVDEQLLPRYLTEVGGKHHNLFSYPAQSNFSGVRHPLAWIERAQEHGWAAAYVPTNRLDLSRWHPDFVALSFYKMFGWPTGVGALLARREALARLERPWFSGGTIVAAFVQREWYESAPGAAHFEDGTV